ncbi:hypothetical protein [Rhodococcus jostii]|uniref:hypothetical protein n=1 Tax=Rhodococcus jostii TaxID=132919 RepID=UPI0036290599
MSRYEQALRLLTAHPDGLTLVRLHRLMEGDPSLLAVRRTLQRLIDDDKVHSINHPGGLRYHTGRRSPRPNERVHDDLAEPTASRPG